MISFPIVIIFCYHLMEQVTALLTLSSYISGWELTLEIYNVIFFLLSVTSNQYNLLTLKTIVSPNLKSNRLKCCTIHCGEAGCWHNALSGGLHTYCLMQELSGSTSKSSRQENYPSWRLVIIRQTLHIIYFHC